MVTGFPRGPGTHGRPSCGSGYNRVSMMFRFATPRTGGFWMKNTVLPLSIAYAGSDGVISSIVDMQPCRADPCPSYPPDAPYRIALEVNRGQFDVRGVTPGWRIELPDDLPPPPDG